MLNKRIKTMYQLSLKKVEKEIEPYFEINLKNNNSNKACRLFSDSLQDLKAVLIELKKEYDQKTKKITDSKEKQYSGIFVSTKNKLNLAFDIEVESKKVCKKVKKVLNDEELDLYIEESIKEELERVYEYYNNVFGLEDMENLYNPNFNYKINYADLELEDFELLIKTKRNSWGLEKDLTKEIRKRAKKVKDKYTKNKEKYREQEIEEIYYKNSVRPLDFTIKYFNEKEEEFKVEIKEVCELLESF